MTGIDEAGRGCLAGPVVIAAVTWDPAAVAGLPWFPALADSKTLDEKKREFLYPHILGAATRVRTALIGNIIIDHLNILRATLHGFECVAPEYDPDSPLVIDGNQKPPSLPWALTLVKGDSRASAVAAAGIVAKVSRDAVMKRAAAAYPDYGFAVHKGYATKKHRDQIGAHGNTPLHRKSFKPCSLQSDDEIVGAALEAQLDQAVDHADLVRCWHGIQRVYHRLPLACVRKLLPEMQRRGLSVLPQADDGARWNAVGSLRDTAPAPAAPQPCQNDAPSMEVSSGSLLF
ncbi:ribonuclease HII [Acanthopleuribacter pedis]|uniref:Ribonuclease n=1 Tax=Acanthopleuribacter pedis TaxID=442870 RepID=A0A8J7Q9H6_9BACT|nr:ribonuclease HII [Acanthopleuribacter pedis]MBO1316856.1 ribonuclease HII [Acanthopleuribacter pedis]